MLTLGTGVGGGLVIDDRLYRGWAELGHVVVVAGGQPCQGNCHGRGHLEAHASGLAADRAAAELYGPGADAPVLVARARAGDARAIEALGEIGRLLGAAIGSLVNIFDPDVVIVGGGFGAAAAELVLEPAREAARARGDSARRRDAADRRGGARRRGRPDRGGARRVRGARRSAVRPMPLAVCATPIGNLDDVTLRVLERARRGRHRALRGHPPHARAAAAPRDRGPAPLLPPAQRGVADGRARAPPRRRASGWRSSPTRACPGVNDPGARLVAAALDAGVAGDGAAGRRRPSRRRSSRAGSPASSTGSSATCRASAARARRALGGARRRGRIPWSPSSRRGGCRRIAREPRRGRARAPGRGLPRADEGVRGGRARDGAELARAVLGAAEGRDHARRSGRSGAGAPAPIDAAVAAVAELVAAGTPRRVAVDVVARLTGSSRNQLYRASL